jgi:hypothetical protein
VQYQKSFRLATSIDQKPNHSIQDSAHSHDSFKQIFVNCCGHGSIALIVSNVSASSIFFHLLVLTALQDAYDRDFPALKRIAKDLALTNPI